MRYQRRETVTKSELSKLLHSLDIPVDEGITSPDNLNECPRIVYWQYIWDYVMSSGGDYENLVTYQISFYSRRPSDPKLLELREILKEEEQYPLIYHEYVSDDKVWHSYFSLEVVE